MRTTRYTRENGGTEKDPREEDLDPRVERICPGPNTGGRELGLGPHRKELGTFLFGVQSHRFKCLQCLRMNAKG